MLEAKIRIAVNIQEKGGEDVKVFSTSNIYSSLSVFKKKLSRNWVLVVYYLIREKLYLKP